MGINDNQHGKLYLGRAYDLKTDAITDQPIMYNARHLTTHGVILGMTGSGKTGAGIVLLEDALLQGIPILALDPKGDIVNLLLTFPQLRAEDFEPWVDIEGVQRQGGDVKAYAAQQAQMWRQGLAEWGITGQRIARLRQTAQFTVFTPGSQAGQAVDVLHDFNAPAADWEVHEESLRERIGGLVSALLGLVGIDADPLQSPEHVLLARIIEHVWRAGQSLDLPKLIRLLQKPPFQQVGVFELETFFSEKDRFELARTLNNLIAAPGFEVWQQGTPLDVEALLYTDDDRPRASIFYMAHLNDAQRQFFITLFLESVRDWLRAQSGTSDLRALVYFDEVFGYFPPYPRNPPTKAPLLSLIKQGRAAGLGVVLATQNPADLDYKGLSNAGTWMIGALRTERDQARVLDGLEGAVADAGQMDPRDLDQALGALKSRVFLLHDIRADAPVFFHTRWAMSYLPGPLTRSQLRELLASAPTEAPTMPDEAALPQEAAPDEAASATAVASAAAEVTEPKAVEGQSPAKDAFAGLTDAPPTLPPQVSQVFLPPTVTFEWALRTYEEQSGRSLLVRERSLVYAPHLLALGNVRMLDRKRGVDHQQTVARLLRRADQSIGIDWTQGQAVVNADELLSKPMGQGLYHPVPSTLSRQRELKRWEKDYADYLYYNVSVTILHNPALDLYSAVDEGRRDFRVRCDREVQRQRDGDLQELRKRMQRDIDRIKERIRREERELRRDESELTARKREEVLGLGESVLNLVSGRRLSTSISRAGRRRTRTQDAKADVEESLEALEDLEEQIEMLKADWEEKAAEVRDRWADTLEQIETFEVRPRRVDVVVDFCGLAWVPVWRVVQEEGRSLDLPARESVS